MLENCEVIKKKILKYDVFIKSFFLNVLCVLFWGLICEIHFDTDTDQFFNHIFSGVYGYNDPAYGWINIFAGYFIKTLYVIIPQLPWYALAQYFCIFVCFLLLTNIIFKVNSKWGAYVVNLLILILIGYECYARISYLKTGVLCITTASFVFYHICSKRIREKIYLILGIFLFIVGFLWWSKSLFFGLPILFPCVYHLYKRKDLTGLKDYKRYIIVGSIIIFCPVLLEIGNRFYLKCHPEVEKSVEFTKTLEYINRYGWPDFSEYYSQYEELGISENTYSLLIRNGFVDRYIVDPDVLEKIKDFVNKPAITTSDFLKFTRTYPIQYFETGLFIGFLIVLILFYLSKVGNKGKKSAYFFLVTGFIYYICYLVGVDDVEVVRTIIWMMAIISILAFSYNIAVEGSELKPYYSAVITIAMVILLNKKLTDITKIVDENYMNSTTEWMELIANDSSKIYVINNTDYYQKDMPFQPLKKGSQSNFLVSRFPYIFVNSRDFRDVLNNPEELYFLTESSAFYTANYVNEHDGTNYYPVQVKNVNGNNFYMIRDGNPDIDKEIIKKAGSDIISELSLYTLESGNKVVEGNIYKKDSDSFSQKCYVEVYNSVEDSYTFYDVSQTQSSFSSDVMNGKYSAIYAEIELTENSDNDEYAVLLEIDGSIYRVSLFKESEEEVNLNL